MPPTQAQIAAKFNVSQVTVSRALNGDAGVSEKLRRAIQREAERSGYSLEHNFSARAMRKSALGKPYATNVIAAILPGDLTDYSFTGQFLHGLSEAAPKLGCEVAVFTHLMGEEPLIVSRQQVDGVVRILGDVDVNRGVVCCSVPWVSVIWDVPEADIVGVNQTSGVAELAEHLWSLGHRSIGYIGPDMELSHERLQGLRQTYQAHGVQHREKWVQMRQVTLPPDVTRSMLTELRARSPELTAVICYNDSMAATAVQHLEASGLNVPADFSIAGFDGALPTHSLSRAITTAAIPLQSLGSEALHLLTQRLADTTRPRRTLTLATTLRIGDTTGPAPSRP